MRGFCRLLVVATLFGARRAVAEPPADRAVASWVSKHAVPIRLDGDGPLPGLVPLIARARLIGVGESVHNQHEFLVLRFRLLRELVACGRVTTLVLESGLPEGIGVDRYVTGQSDTIDFDAALKYGFGAQVQRVSIEGPPVLGGGATPSMGTMPEPSSGPAMSPLGPVTVARRWTAPRRR